MHGRRMHRGGERLEEPCTENDCDSSVGCTTLNLEGPCDDGDACTADDLCGNGVCVSPSTCDDGNICTIDKCDSVNGCEYESSDSGCDDGNECTVGDLCVNSLCEPGAEKDCNDDDVCTDDACVPETGCVNTANTDPCDDGDACTTGDTCSNFVCLGGEATVCSDDNPCTLDGCEKDTGCGTPMPPWLATTEMCTEDDTCSEGSCVGTPKTDADCDDGNPCTTDVVYPNRMSTFVAGDCDDGNA